MRTLGSVSAVVAAIREEAEAELERVEREANDVVAAHPEHPAPDRGDAAADPRVMAARARAQDDQSQDEWNSTLQELRDRERWVEAVVAAGRRLAESADGRSVRDWTGALIAEAVEFLPPGPCVAVVPARVVDLLDAHWREALSARIKRSLTVEPGPVTAGCIVRLVDQPIAYDNSLEARERRTEMEWRALLARVYADAVSHVDSVASAAVSVGSSSGIAV